MGIHVKDGTPMQSSSLCESCVFAHVKRGYRESDLLVMCVAAEPAHRVPFPVRKCSVHRDKTRSSRYEMEKIALTITPRDPKRTGFVPSSEPAAVGSEIELTLDDKL